MTTFLAVIDGCCVFGTCLLMVPKGKSLQVSPRCCIYSVHTNIGQVFMACVGVMSEASNTEVRTEKLAVTFKHLKEGLVIVLKDGQ